MATPAEHLQDHATSTAPVRIITAAALFDGHDAAIHVVRRLLQGRGAEVIHLGHSRGVEEIVRAALQEDVDAIAVSSYQGGHLEYFGFLVERLRAAGADHVRLFCGGGGTITPPEARQLEQLGVTRVYSAGHRDRTGLETIADEVISLCQRDRPRAYPGSESATDDLTTGRWLTRIENGEPAPQTKRPPPCPVIGVTGTGGAGKSTLLDTLLGHFLQAFPDRRVAVLAVDPTHRRSGGALLGDRIRFNSLSNPRVFFRSMATRRSDAVTSAALGPAITFLRTRGFSLVLVETVGIGQSNAEVTDLTDLSVYVMTPDYGGTGQLEKIEMLDWADLVVLNKFDRAGAQDALREVRRQRRHYHPDRELDHQVSVFPCVASRTRDPGAEPLYRALCQRLDHLPRSASRPAWTLSGSPIDTLEQQEPVAAVRKSYLGEIARHLRELRRSDDTRVEAAGRTQSLYQSLQALRDPLLPAPLEPYPETRLTAAADTSLQNLRRAYNAALTTLSDEHRRQLAEWSEIEQAVTAERYAYAVRGQIYSGKNFTRSLAGLAIPKLAAPATPHWGERLRFLLDENLPGRFPYTAGVFPYRRRDEEPTRMFAGEGGPEQTNRRFHYLVAGQPTRRLSTAFDPVTLYGEDPSSSPDVLGRVGMSGVSVASLDDVKVLYSGLDLADARTSVSMTINGPAPIVLAQFFNAAVDREIERHLRGSGAWSEAERHIQRRYRDLPRPRYRDELPPGHDGLGLGLLGVSGAELVTPETYVRIRDAVLGPLRGTVQADILKEDQAQNECIFDVEFALRLMGDVQGWCIRQGVRNFYTVSVSGYHIAEAGANPVTQLAFTLANGFTLLEYFLARGLAVDEVAPRLSFFFSNALDPEYAVIGRVARRIWARALRDLYRAGPSAQRLKYHAQTSGRSLQARDIDLNDVRTTLEALYAHLDSCNSLHTNAYDEAVTTPTEASVRRALGIQAILQREFGLSLNQNVLQGSYFINRLTDTMEQAVLEEFERLDERGGVLGAMETGYQRNRIQAESLEFERRKQDGSLPVVGVNTFVASETRQTETTPTLTRFSESEQRARVATLRNFQQAHAEQAHQQLHRLQDTIRRGDNSFEALMETVRHCSLGQITHALYEVGGRYRRRL